MMSLKLIKGKPAFSLIELLIVVVVLLVVLGAVMLFLLRGTESFHFASMQNQLTTAGRLTLSEMKNSIIWAGYMPQGGWDEDDWHPIVAVGEDSLEFYADWEPMKSLDSTDYRMIELLDDGYVEIRDREDYVKLTGDGYITHLEFTYLNEDGSTLDINDPQGEAMRDQIRHIQIEITLTAQSGDDIYQTVMQTTVSPRNLGINHNINPGFYGPPAQEGYIVFNVAGADSVPAASAEEQAMIDRLSFWGYTTTQLTDAMLTSYNYDDISLLILRHVSSGTHLHVDFFRSLEVPIITMNGREAAETFLMGDSYGTIDENSMLVEEPAHPLNRDLPSTFSVYADSGYHSSMYDFRSGTTLLTRIDAVDDSSGVSVINEAMPTRRRVHFSPWQATQFTENGGWVLFKNAIEWISYTPDEDPGEALTEEETFDVAYTEEMLVTLWEDGIDPSIATDTTIVYSEDFESKFNPSWQYTPGPINGRCGIITEGGMTFLRLDRDVTGPSVQNMAVWNVDLSDFNENTDNLILKMDSKAGTWETLHDLDGVYLHVESTSTDTLFTIDFEPVRGRTPGDIHYSGSGRVRVHSPSTWQGNGQFITMDAQYQGQYAYNRVMIEASTVGYSNGDVFTVHYRFHDHSDDNHDSGTQSDFVGWNSTGDIDGSFEIIEYLNPNNYSDYSWHDRSVSFTPSSMPDSSIYIIFGQYGNYQADLFNASDGISLDNIILTVTHDDSVYVSIAQPQTSGLEWNTLALDLDAAARSNDQEFSSSFEIMLSQYDQGSWPNYGRGWDDIEIASLTDENTVPGWEHNTLYSDKKGYTGIDDWRIGSESSNDYWEIQNDEGGFSDSSYCYLQTPSVYIPSTAIETFFSFKHQYNTQSNSAGGYVQISSDNGVTWSILPLGYTGICSPEHPAPANTHIYYGAGSRYVWQTASADLSSFAGNLVIIRFVFGAAATVTDGFWKVDDLLIQTTVDVYSIQSIAFNVTSDYPDCTFNNVDIYMSSIPDDSAFTGAGEWNTYSMTLAADGVSLQVQESGWQSISLDSIFYLPEGQQLAVKIEKADSASSEDIVYWEHIQTSDYMCRRSSNDNYDPSVLVRSNDLPFMKIGTSIAEIACDIGLGSTNSISESPLNSEYVYSDFEGIYSFADAAGGIPTAWTHAGTNDDWEFGAPVVVPDVDPWLVPENDGSIAGTDLSDDGYYNNDAWAYLISPAYEMPDSEQSSVILRFDRCVRLSGGDDALVFIGFSEDEDYPTDEEDWILIRTYNTNHSYWDTEEIEMSTAMEAGHDDNADYFFIRYVQSSGSDGVRGGWNLDNVQVFGDAE